MAQCINCLVYPSFDVISNKNKNKMKTARLPGMITVHKKQCVFCVRIFHIIHPGVTEQKIIKDYSNTKLWENNQMGVMKNIVFEENFSVSLVCRLMKNGL